MSGTLEMITRRFDELMHRAAQTHRLSPFLLRLVALAPVAVFVAWASLMVTGPSRRFAFWVLEENHPVELLTFGFALAGGIQSAILARRLFGRDGPAWVPAFYTLFAMGLLFLAGEEVAWGQWLVGFETPAAIKDLNAQGELTLHNLHGMQGHTELLRIGFGLGGLLGVALGRVPALRPVSVPPVLALWFLVVVGHASVDLWNDFFPFRDHLPLGGKLDQIMSRTSEITEMLVAGGGFFYVWLRARSTAPA